MPRRFLRLRIAGIAAGAEIPALHAVARPEQVLEEILVALAGRAQQVRAPHEQVARPVGRMIGILAAHLQRAVLQSRYGVVFRVLARGLRGTDDLERVHLQLRRAGQPAHALGADVEVDHRAGIARLVGERGEDLADPDLLVAPLVRVGIEEARAVHLPRRADPVQRERERRPSGLRPQLLLADVVRPAATALADAAAEHQHVDDRAVIHVAVVPVVHSGADDHHRLAMRLVGVVGELSRDRDRLCARNAGDRLLPRRRVGEVVVVAGGGLAGKAAGDAVVRREEVEHRRHPGLARGAFLAQRQPHRRRPAHAHVAALRIRGEVGHFLAAEVRERDLDRFVRLAAVLDDRQLELHFVAAASVLRFEVPAARVLAAVGAPAEADRAVGQHHLAGGVESDRLPVGVVVLSETVGEVARPDVAVGHPCAATAGQRRLLQFDQQRQVGVAPRVIVEIGRAGLAVPAEIELLQDHVAHRHRQRGIGSLLGMHPQVGELADLCVIGRDRDDLRPLVAHLGEEVRIGRARLRHVRSPGDQERAVVPVGALRHVGLLAPGLRGGGRQVAVPVVEAQVDAADQAQVATPRGIADHAHRRDRREADHPVGAVLLDRVDVGAGDQLVQLVPGRTDEAAEATLRHPFLACSVVLDDACPGIDGRFRDRERGAPVLEQPRAHQRVFDAVGAVQVPRVRCAARATPRLMVGQVGSRARIVGLLGLPGDDAALDVDLPRARAGAVGAVGAADDLVVLPASAIGVFPGPVLAGRAAVAVGEILVGLREVGDAVEKMAHEELPECREAGVSTAFPRSCARNTTR